METTKIMIRADKARHTCRQFRTNVNPNCFSLYQGKKKNKKEASHATKTKGTSIVSQNQQSI